MNRKKLIVIIGLIIEISSCVIYCLLKEFRDIYFAMSLVTILYAELVFFAGLYLTENIAVGNKESFVRFGYYSSLFIFAVSIIALALLNGPNFNKRTYYSFIIVFSSLLIIILIILKKVSVTLANKDEERIEGYDELYAIIAGLSSLSSSDNKKKIEKIIDDIKYSDPKAIDVQSTKSSVLRANKKLKNDENIDDELENIRNQIINKNTRGGL